jgi:hypothetical protein
VAIAAISTWGGSRPGAGRPARGPVPSEPHKRRPELSPHHPVHVIARWTPAIRRLRRRAGTRAVWTSIRRAVTRSLARADFRIVVHAARASRLELVVEADDRVALARGMQGFQVAAARHLNALARRSGTVFPDRYRARPLTTRPAVRATLGGLPGHPDRVAWPVTELLTSVLVEPSREPPDG